MKKILVTRAVYQPIENGQQKEFFGIKVVNVCDSWTPSMGLIIDSGTDPYMPKEFSCFSNEAGVAVVSLPWYKVETDEVLEDLIDLFLKDWHRIQRFDHYTLSIEDVLLLPSY